MTLIDCFNVFQEVAKSLKLSANARSLYIAILGEFNSARYPNALNLSNRFLQDTSGIDSERSFHSARNALMNAKLILQKKQVYRLTPNDALEKMHQRFNSLLETACNYSEDSLQTPCSQLAGSLQFSNSTPISKNNIDVEEEKKKITTTPTAETRARELTACSEEVAEAWFLAEQKYPHGYDAHNLAYFEQLYTTEKVVDAIKKAQAANTENRLNTNYIKRILENESKGGTKNGSNNIKRPVLSPEKWETRQLDWIDG